MKTLLFLDNQFLNVIDNSEFILNKIEIWGEPYIDPAQSKVSICWGYPFVFYSSSLSKYIMLYQGWSKDKDFIKYTLPLCAISDDGNKWKPYDTSLYFVHDKILFNQILPTKYKDMTICESQFFYLENLKSQYKYIALCLYITEEKEYKALIMHSKDGLTWKIMKGAVWHNGTDAPDYPVSVYYDKQKDVHVICKRPTHNDRRISLSVTRDFKKVTESKLILQPDVLDGVGTDMYGMHVRAGDGFYLGLIMLYHTPNYLEKDGKKVSGTPTHKFWGGRVDTQLTYSLNGESFQRYLRKPLFGGDRDKYGCIYPTCIFDRNDEWYIYASATTEEHGYIADGQGQIISYKVAKNRFGGIRGGVSGLLITRGLYFKGDSLSFNIDARNGFARVQICDPHGKPYDGFSFSDCTPLTTDDSNHSFTFKNRIEELKNKVLVLHIELKNATLYSVTGDLFKVTPYQVMLWVNNKIIPQQIDGI